MWGRQIIHAGFRWRIGNGQQIEIHKSNWIPKSLTFKPVFKPNMPTDALVSELINEENRWDEKLIYSHFDRLDVDSIVRIPLLRRPREDEIIWHYEKKRQYTVKSGYQTTLKLKFPAMPSSSEAMKNQWNIIWNLALPEKIKIFVWRATKNLLPSAENLWKRKIIQEPTCQACKTGLENVLHVLVDCKVAKKIWRLTHMEDDIRGRAGQDILTMMHDMNRRRGKADLEMMVTIFWVMITL